MERLCERPGCSEFASVAYGMRAEDLVFWLDVQSGGDDVDRGVLCQRHADSMVVPRGWTLDDLRDPDLHLFRPPTAVARTRPGRVSRPARGRVAGEQLQLGHVVSDTVEGLESGPSPSTIETELAGTTGAAAAGRSANGGGGVSPGPWSPNFDEADDLDGLLSAHSPLLSRAFRTADRADE